LFRLPLILPVSLPSPGTIAYAQCLRSREEGSGSEFDLASCRRVTTKKEITLPTKRERLLELIDEATVDCYNEDEEHSGG
jgi:hypothetical protein